MLSMPKKIGLRRGTVKLVAYDKSWKGAFECERKRLLAKVGDIVVEIHHIGSTAVKGAYAKPIIDMGVGVKKMSDAKKLVKRLAKLDYHFYRESNHEIFFAKGPDAKRTHYLHAMRYKGSKWNADALFRDYLNAHPARAKAYADLKKKLAKKYSKNRTKYTTGKEKFIKATLRLARRRNPLS